MYYGDIWDMHVYMYVSVYGNIKGIGHVVPLIVTSNCTSAVVVGNMFSA